MNCKDCPFNKDSKKYNKALINKISLPNQFQNFFECNSLYSENFARSKNDICPAVVWGVVFIGSSDEFSIENSESILNELVRKGQSELLCSFFENAPYNIRRKLWLKMTTTHINQLYLFNQLFERKELNPLNELINKKYIPIYQNKLFQSN